MEFTTIKTIKQDYEDVKNYVKENVRRGRILAIEKIGNKYCVRRAKVKNTHIDMILDDLNEYMMETDRYIFGFAYTYSTWNGSTINCFIELDY